MIAFLIHLEWCEGVREQNGIFDLLASTASHTKGAKIEKWYFMIPLKKWFSNIKIKLNSKTWMTLESSAVIFQALPSLQPQWPWQPQQPHFTQKILSIMFRTILLPKWPILVSQCGMDHQKSTILQSFGTLSLGLWRLWRPSYETKINSKNKGQISKLNEYTDNFKSNLTWIFLSVRTKLK